MKYGYRSKEALVKIISAKAGKDDAELNELIEEDLPMTVALDVNDLLDNFSENMPKEFYKTLWNIMRDAAFIIYDQRMFNQEI